MAIQEIVGWYQEGKVMVILGDFVPNLFSLFMPVDGVSLYPFVFIRTCNHTLLRHEQIHHRQQQETLAVSLVGFILAITTFKLSWWWILCSYFVFYAIYLAHFFWLLVKNRNFDIAYTNITYEAEAYDHQYSLDYLANRLPFANFKSNPSDKIEWDKDDY